MTSEALDKFLQRKQNFQIEGIGIGIGPNSVDKSNCVTAILD